MPSDILDTGLTPDEFELAFDAAASGAPIEPEVPAKSEDVPAEPPPTPPVEPAAPPAPPLETVPQEPPPTPPAPPMAAEPVVPEPVAPVIDEAARAAEQFTTEEKTLYDQVEADFPEISKLLIAVERRVEAKFRNTFAEELSKVRQEVAQQVAPAVSEAQMSAQQRHNAVILQAHPDAFEIVPTVSEWVEKQPGFLKATFKKVLDSGSAAEVVDLLNVYKKEAAPEAAPVTAPVKDPEKEDRLAAQEGVTGRRSSRQATLDPNDFEGAFEKFAASA